MVDDPSLEDVDSGHQVARPTRVLVVANDPEYEDMLRSVLGKLRLNSPLEAAYLHKLADARRVASVTHVDVVLSEFVLPDGTSDELFRQLEILSPGAERVVLSHRENDAFASEQLLANGARVWVKGHDARDMSRRMERVLEVRALSQSGRRQRRT